MASSPTGELDPEVLGRILVLQSNLHAASDETRLLELATHGLAQLPGVAGCAACVDGVVTQAEPRRAWSCLEHSVCATSDPPGPTCPLGRETTVRRHAIQTAHSVSGAILLGVVDETLYEPYDAFVANVASTAALCLENSRYILELGRLNASLAELVDERTRELRQSQALLDATQRLAHVGGWEWDVDRQVMLWTDETYLIHGMTPGDLSTGSPEHIERSLACYHPDCRPIIEEAFRRCVEQGQPYALDLRLVRLDGRTIWVHTQGRPVWEEGRVTRVTGNVVDITERKQVEERLTRTTHMLEMIREAQASFISTGDQRSTFNSLLHTLVSLTDSAFGFLDEVLVDSDGSRFKLSLALSDISWSAETQELYEALRARRLEFRDLHNLAGLPALTGEVLIANDAPNDSRSGGLPKGHPDIRTFMGMPMYFGDALVGVAGVANRADGYDEDMAASLEPFLATVAGIIHAARLQAREREAVEALRRSEENLREAHRIAGMGRWELDLATDTLHWSDGIYEIFEVAPDSFEASYEAFLSFVHPDDRDLVDAAFRESVSAGDPYQVDHRLLLRDGRVKWVSEIGRSECDASGRPVRSSGVVQDITERKRVEEALRESEESHRALIDGLPDIVMRFDPEGRHLFVSDNVREVVDMEADDCIGKTHRDLGFPEELCEVWGRSIKRVYETGRPFETEFSIEGKDSNTVMFNWRLVPELDSDGTVRTVLSIGRDVTAHRQAEHSYQMLFREMLDGFAQHEIICNDAGEPVDYRFIAVNPSFERMTGLRAEDILGRTVLEILPGTEPHWVQTYGPVALTGVPAYLEQYSSDLDKWFEVTAFRPAAGQFACILADITQRKRAEEERSRLEAQLQQAQKMESIGRLAGGVAHDFNNMLSVILGHAELMLETLAPSQTLYADVQEIKRAAERSAALTRQLLAFARKQTIAPEILDLNESVEQSLRMLRRLVGEHIAITWRPAEGLWPVMMDPAQADQILANLCVNARDAIVDQGDITIATANVVVDGGIAGRLLSATPGDYVVLSVSDSGCGIEPDMLPQIFEPFFTTKGADQGTGLGLPTVYGIVRQNGGHIDVDSKQGHGTTFTIYLPRHTEGYRTPHREAMLTHRAGGPATILLVEDEPSILAVTTMMLEHLGFTVLGAGTPSEAIRLAQERAGDFDLLMTDVVMPEMNGRDLAQKLLSIQPGLKRLFVSGYTADVIAHQGALDEGVDFIQKPFAFHELAAKLSEILRHR